jgi:glucose 1-dehydrogenase
VLTVRRGCGNCPPCSMRRSDMCRTGKYRERGIVKLHGYQCEYVVEDEKYVVPVPAFLREVGVLLDPLSVIEKALDEAVHMQQTRLAGAGRSPWLFGKKCLVAGVGPVGLLAVMALRLRGAEVTGMDIVPAGSPRPRLLAALGGSYVDTSGVPPHDLRQVLEADADMVVEATGIPPVAFHLLETLTPGGAYAVIGIPEKEEIIPLPAAAILRRLVLSNQLIVGSVNASVEHFRLALADLAAGLDHWSAPLRSLVTHRFKPEEMPERILAHTTDKIKAVVEWR